MKIPFPDSESPKKMGVDTGSTFPIGEGHLTLSWMPQIAQALVRATEQL
jgi:hypothetical protein